SFSNPHSAQPHHKHVHIFTVRRRYTVVPLEKTFRRAVIDDGGPIPILRPILVLFRVQSLIFLCHHRLRLSARVSMLGSLPNARCTVISSGINRRSISSRSSRSLYRS